MWHDHAWSQTFNKSLGSGIESGLRAASYSRSQGQKKTGTHRLQSNSLLVSLNHTPEMPDGKTSAVKAPKKKLRICCACPETRKPRDKCIITKGPENCSDLIEAHKVCLRKAGFKV